MALETEAQRHSHHSSRGLEAGENRSRSWASHVAPPCSCRMGCCASALNAANDAAAEVLTCPRTCALLEPSELLKKAVTRAERREEGRAREAATWVARWLARDMAMVNGGAAWCCLLRCRVAAEAH